MNYDAFVELKGGGILSEALCFVSRAVSTDETRFFMNWILMEMEGEKLRAVATDGRRMHIAEIAPNAFGLRHGTWRAVKATNQCVQLARVADEHAKDVGPFPNYRRVIPDGTPDKVFSFYGFTMKRIGKQSPDLCRFMREFPDPAAFNLSYLEDLGGEGEEWHCEWRKGPREETSLAVVFKSGMKTAIVMPMSTN